MKQKREMIIRASINKESSESFNCEREESKLKEKKYPGLNLLKQKLQYDNDLDGETIKQEIIES